MAIMAFLEEARSAIRVRQFSRRTEEVCLHRIIEFIHYHRKCNPATLGALEVGQYLTYLVVEKNIATSTQNDARSASFFCTVMC